MLKELGKPMTVREVAKALGVTEKWIYRHWRNLGGVKLGRRKLRFFEKRIVEVVNALQEDAQRESGMDCGCSDQWAKGDRNPQDKGRGKGKRSGNKKSAQTGKGEIADKYGVFASMVQ